MRARRLRISRVQRPQAIKTSECSPAMADLRGFNVRRRLCEAPAAFSRASGSHGIAVMRRRQRVSYFRSIDLRLGRIRTRPAIWRRFDVRVYASARSCLEQQREKGSRAHAPRNKIESVEEGAGFAPKPTNVFPPSNWRGVHVWSPRRAQPILCKLWVRPTGRHPVIDRAELFVGRVFAGGETWLIAGGDCWTTPW